MSLIPLLILLLARSCRWGSASPAQLWAHTDPALLSSGAHIDPALQLWAHRDPQLDFGSSAPVTCTVWGWQRESEYGGLRA